MHADHHPHEGHLVGRRQIELLQEIARRQQEEIHEGRAESIALLHATFPHLDSAASNASPSRTSVEAGLSLISLQQSHLQELADEEEKVAQLRRELQDLRGVRADSERHAAKCLLAAICPSIARTPDDADRSALNQQNTRNDDQGNAAGGQPVPVEIGSISGPEAEARRKAERKQWDVELESIRALLSQAKQRSRELEQQVRTAEEALGKPVRGSETRLDELTGKLAADRAATEALQARTAQFKRAIASERDAFETHRVQEAFETIGRQFEAERAQRRSQLTEIADSARATEEIRARLELSKNANAELRAVLQRQQALLQNLG